MSDARSPMTGRLIFGSVVMILGVLFTLDNLGLLDSGEILAWWPLTIVALGVSRLTGVFARRHLTGGIILTLVGLLFLNSNLGFFGRDVVDFWPALMIVMGVLIVSGSLQRRREGAGNEESSSQLNAFALMSGTTRKLVTQTFRGGDVMAVMGGHDLDLRQAKIEGESAVMDLFVWWGGVDIKIPPGWKVSCEALAIMGAVEDNTKAPAGEVGGTLVLRGLVVMGGVEVKN